ncbi:MAG: hypothetical protein ACRELD_01350 [Longimicrobiales bacterium]
MRDVHGERVHLVSPNALLAASLALLGVAAVLQALQLVLGGWPTLVPVVLAVYTTPFLLWAIWARRRVRRASAPWLAAHASLLGVPLMAGGLIGNALATGVQSRTVERMRWQIVAEGSDSTVPEVVLRFVNAPEHHVGMRSRDVAAYLRDRGDALVDVEFELTRDYGRLRSYNAVRIGQLTGWRSTFAYGGCSGSCSGSPF